jgi:hypothetical protein
VSAWRRTPAASRGTLDSLIHQGQHLIDPCPRFLRDRLFEQPADEAVQRKAVALCRLTPSAKQVIIDGNRYRAHAFSSQTGFANSSV